MPRPLGAAWLDFGCALVYRVRRRRLGLVPWVLFGLTPRVVSYVGSQGGTRAPLS